MPMKIGNEISWMNGKANNMDYMNNSQYLSLFSGCEDLFK